MAEFATGAAADSEVAVVASAELARQNGVFRTAQALRLDYNKLKRCMLASARYEAGASAASGVRGTAHLAAGPACECIIELEGPRARAH